MSITAGVMGLGMKFGRMRKEAHGFFGRHADVGRHKRILKRQMGIKSCPIAKNEYGSGTRVIF